MRRRALQGGVKVWCGDYQFGGDDLFLHRAASVGRRYVDREPESRPPKVAFREALEDLRDDAPLEGQALIDQLVHRWANPDSPPCLYVLTCTLRAPEGAALLDGGARVKELVCTKVGRAKRTVAARLPRYKTDVLGGVPVIDGSPSLRVLVYGEGPTMLMEHQMQQFARARGVRAQVVDETGQRRVGSETYVGSGLVDALCSFARERQHARPAAGL
jgi:hypothetical protein